MDNDFVNKLKETFQDLKNIKPERLQELMKDTLLLVQGLQDKLKSDDPKVKQEALEETLQIRTALQEQAAKLSQASGFSLAELAALVEKQPPQTEAAKEMKEEFEVFKVALQTLTPKSEPKKHVTKPLWIAG